jgi:hypothetical protein
MMKIVSLETFASESVCFVLRRSQWKPCATGRSPLR